MKSIPISCFFLGISFSLISNLCCGQKNICSIKLSSTTSIISEIVKFNPKKHNTDTCMDGPNSKYICKIDKKSWYGSERSLALPSTQLLSLTLKIKGQKIPLNVSGMFNPSYSYKQAYVLSTKQFKIKKSNAGYLLFGYFSDGAGTYTVHWKITNGISKRILLSTDEEDFSWQLEK